MIVALVRSRSDVTGTDVSSTASESDGTFEGSDAPYSFDLPEGWEVDNEDAVTKLLSPGNDIAIAIGPAPRGDVLSSSDRLVDGVADRYSDAITESRDLTRVGGNLGLTVAGTAVNEFGVKVRFSITTIEGSEDKNYAITSFSALDARGADRALKQVIQDFEIVR